MGGLFQLWKYDRFTKGNMVWYQFCMFHLSSCCSSTNRDTRVRRLHLWVQVPWAGALHQEARQGTQGQFSSLFRRGNWSFSSFSCSFFSPFLPSVFLCPEVTLDSLQDVSNSCLSWFFSVSRLVVVGIIIWREWKVGTHPLHFSLREPFELFF